MALAIDGSATPNTPAPNRSITLRFLAAPTDVTTLGGTIQGGRILEWIDKAAYACAVGWSASYCVTAYVGNIRFARPIESGHVVEVEATLVHTGRSSMHIQCTVSSADPRTGEFTKATDCLVIFVAVDSEGKSVRVPAWAPVIPKDRDASEQAAKRIRLRADIEAEMGGQNYTDAGTAPKSVLRFLAAPTDVNWGGKTHGGTVMRWIDEAAYVCGTSWTGTPTVGVYSGGVRFYRPIPIGHIVEVEARLLHTGAQTMHVSVHVRSGDPRTSEMNLTTHCLTVIAAVDEQEEPTRVRQWVPQSDEDRALDAHARELIAIRNRMRGSAF